MQPCSREMQGVNSLLNQAQIQMNNNFDPASNDDFLKQILSNLPSSSWTLDPNPKPLWDATNSDETTPDNVVYPYDDQSNLASKFRNHQISDKASALMLHQQLLNISPNSSLLHIPLSTPNDPSSFKSPTPPPEASVQALFNGFSGSLQPTPQPSNHSHHFQQPTQGQNLGGAGSAPAPGQPKQRVRARRGQATDPHSIAERLRRERIAERMKALQELVPNANKTDKASMLDEIIDYVKFLQLQVKVLSMSRLGGAAAVAPLVADMSSEGGEARNGSNDSLAMTEQQVAKLMEEDMGSAMQYLQGKGLCLMPISLATAISTASCHTRNNPFINPNGGDGPSSPGISALTVQSAALGGESTVKDAASVSKS
ncbi:hypothetical protein RJT34_32723 [Clitoria ternatea]|uniref:BHLH domain-containing protein n=1 Tax=Clitoria ternatea TaxID=43366 RepID=A0AAN9EWZ5_CLITE